MREKIKKYINQKGITVRKLAEEGNTTERTLYNFFAGSSINTSVIENWAKKMPEMVCYMFSLDCQDYWQVEYELEEEDSLSSQIEGESKELKEKIIKAIGQIFEDETK